MAIQGNKKLKLSVETILSKITEYDIFKFYMPKTNWKINVATNSPFRKDDNPSFLISNRGGNIHFIDFADGDKKGNCFKFVQQLHNCDFNTSLMMINIDFGLGIGETKSIGDYKVITSKYSQPTQSTKRYSLIQVVTKKFTKEELAYWNQYHLDIQDLRDNNIYSVSKVYLNKQLFNLKDDLRFGYFYDGHWKIYRPYVESKYKWVPNNVPITAMDGRKDIVNCDVALITKSKKDYMVLKKLYPHVCAVQNEGISCFSEENLSYIKENSNKQILAFDSDPTGVKNSQEITKLYGFDYINVPRSYLSDGIKDMADLAKDYGMSKVEQVLKKKKLL